MSLSTLGYAGLETALNQYISLDPNTREQLVELYGRVIAIELSGPEIRVYLLPAPDGIKVLEKFEGEPDCLLKGSLMALARMGDRRASTEQLFSGTVSISGNTEVAHQFGKLLGAIDIDWEEQLSKLTGDIVAHKVGNLFRNAAGWGSQVQHTAALNIEEYLKEELNLLPNRTELRAHLDEIDRVRDGVERLQARLSLLRNRLESSS